MTQDISTLVDRIEALTREEVMEAGLALSQELDAGDVSDAEGRRFVESVESAPLQHIVEAEELARVLLLAAAADPELAPTVEEILDSVGGKAFILGGLEIVALAALAVAALHIVVSKGRKSDVVETTLHFGPDGRVTDLTVKKDRRFGISANIGKILASAAGAPPPPAP